MDGLNKNDVTAVIEMIMTMGFYMANSDDKDQNLRDLNDTVEMLAGLNLGLGAVLGLGVKSALGQPHIMQEAVVHTGNWRETVASLRELDLSVAEEMCLELCSRLNELSGRELYQLQVIADSYL